LGEAFFVCCVALPLLTLCDCLSCHLRRVSENPLRALHLTWFIVQSATHLGPVKASCLVFLAGMIPPSGLGSLFDAVRAVDHWSDATAAFGLERFVVCWRNDVCRCSDHAGKESAERGQFVTSVPLPTDCLSSPLVPIPEKRGHWQGPRFWLSVSRMQFGWREVTF